MFLLSIDGAATRLEHYPGEIFLQDRFVFHGMPLAEFMTQQHHWPSDFKIICLHFTFNKIPDLDLSMFDMVLIIDEEVISEDPDQYHRSLCDKFQNTNLRIIVSGHHHGYSLDPDKFFLYPFFLANITRVAVNTKISDALIPWHMTELIDKTFDALLGMSKPHRDFVFYELARHDLLKKCYINYTTNQHESSDQDIRTIYRSPELDALEEPGILDAVPNNTINSYLHINGGKGVKISHIMPWQIYQRSLYSIVAETNWQNYTFFSEKTAKCLLAKRPFVFFGSPNQLSVLRHWGFMTFDEFLDETYDTIQDDAARWHQAFQQVLQLYHSDSRQVYHDLQRVLDHNQNHIRNRSWFLEPLRRWVYQQIEHLQS